MIKWQMKLGVERSNMECIEIKLSWLYVCSSWVSASCCHSGGVAFSARGDSAIRTCQMSMITKDTEKKRENIVVPSCCLCLEFSVQPWSHPPAVESVHWTWEQSRGEHQLWSWQQGVMAVEGTAQQAVTF